MRHVLSYGAPKIGLLKYLAGGDRKLRTQPMLQASFTKPCYKSDGRLSQVIIPKTSAAIDLQKFIFCAVDILWQLRFNESVTVSCHSQTCTFLMPPSISEVFLRLDLDKRGPVKA